MVSVVAVPELGTGVGPELAQQSGEATHTRSLVQQVQLFCTLVVGQTFCSCLCPQAFLLEYGAVVSSFPDMPTASLITLFAVPLRLLVSMGKSD